jgi:hypothetical protein
MRKKPSQRQKWLKGKIIIQGTLTSRIETRQDYYYGFFKLKNQNQEIPVIFKGNKPVLEKGTQVELTGQ